MSRIFQVFPDEWRGARMEKTAMIIHPAEWAESLNMDSRYGWSGAGSTLLRTLGAGTADGIGLTHYYDTAGAYHQVAVLDDGTVYEDGVLLTPTVGLGGILFQDNFSRPDGVPGSNWTTILGTWALAGGALKRTDTTIQTYAAIYADTDAVTPTANMTAQATLWNTTGLSFARRPFVFARMTTVDTYYAAAWDAYQAGVCLYRVVGGVWTQLGTYVAAAPSYPYTLGITTQGTTISLLVNGNVLQTVTDTAITGAGSAGVGAYYAGATETVRFGDFTVFGETQSPIVPDFASGLGSCVIARGTGQAPAWVNPATDVWETLTATAGTVPLARTVAFEPAGPRLLAAPTVDGVDYLAWSAVANPADWSAANGGGSEPIGEDREAIVAIRGGLGDNMAIYKAHHIYMRNGTDPDSWSIDLISSDLGCMAPATICKIGKGHFFCHESGAYLLNAVGAISYPPLTEKIQPLWDAMVEAFPTYLRFAHATYHARERTVYLWMPNQASRVMTRLVKIYLPTGSVTVHDGKRAGASDYDVSGVGRVVYASEGGVVAAVGGTSEQGTAIASRLDTGIFHGNPPKPYLEKGWGKRGKLHAFLEADAALTVTITPTVYQGNSTLSGTGQAVALAEGTVTKTAVYLPSAMGWGASLTVTADQAAGKWRLIGYAGEYEEITDT